MKILQKMKWALAIFPILVACEPYEMPSIIPQTGAEVTLPAAGNYTITFFLGPKGEAKYTLVKN